MTIKKIKGYITRKQNKVNRIKRDLFYSKTTPKNRLKDFDAQKEKEKLYGLERSIIYAGFILDNIEINSKLSDRENQLALFMGRYGGKDLAINYFSQEESKESLVHKINEVQKMYEECGCPTIGKEGFAEYISKPLARLVERTMKKEEYEMLTQLTPIQLFAKVLTYQNKK